MKRHVNQKIIHGKHRISSLLAIQPYILSGEPRPLFNRSLALFRASAKSKYAPLLQPLFLFTLDHNNLLFHRFTS